MIFIWGKKVVRHSLGYVADFCPVCRDLRRFEVKRVGLAGHFYYVSLGEGQLLGHDRTCQECGVDLNAKPETYKSVSRERLPTSELAASTNPGWKQVHANRLALERDIAASADKLPPDLRKALVREPFDLVAPRVEARFAKTQFEARTAGAVVAFFVLLYIAAKLADQFPQYTGLIFGVALVLGIAAIVSQLWGIKDRYFARHVFPVLSCSLRPLRPSVAELEAAKETMRAAGHRLGKMLQVPDLVKAMGGGANAAPTPIADATDMRGSHAS